MTLQTRPHRKSAFNGRRQPKLGTQPKGILGVIEAVAWLLRITKQRWPAQALVRARLSGLIFHHQSGWHVNREIVIRALERRHKRPDQPSALVLYGLGELLARSSRGKAPYISCISNISRRKARQLLNAAKDLAALQIPISPVFEISSRDILREQHLTYEVFRHAEAYLRYPPLPRPRLFGLHVILETFLIAHPRELGQWLAKGHSSAINQTALAYFAERLIYSDDVTSLHRHMLHTQRPILQAMVAVALASNRLHDKLLSFDSLVTLAREAGLDASNAFILGMASAQEACLRRQRARHRLFGIESRLSLLTKSPENAIGGSHNAADEIDRLSAELLTLRETIDQTNLAVDQLIVEIAQAWPSDGLSKSQLTALTQAFGTDAAEMKTRLAQELGGVPRAADLLDDVIEDMSKQLGLAAGVNVFTEYFRPDQEFFMTRKWVSRALSLRYTIDPKGVGYRTSLLLEPLSKAAAQLLDAPYATVRWHQPCESALTRLVCSILLAIDVACGENEHARQERSRLMKLAFDQAISALCRDRPDIDTHGWMDQLASTCVEYMHIGYAPDQRKAWATNPRLPAFARALAAWSDANFIRADPARAETLFLQCASFTSSRNMNRAFSQAVTLLDLAIATGIRDNADHITRQALSIWPSVFCTWPELVGEIWRDLHLMLHDALVTNGQARQKLLNDPQWANSRCANVLRSASSISILE